MRSGTTCRPTVRPGQRLKRTSLPAARKRQAGSGGGGGSSGDGEAAGRVTTFLLWVWGHIRSVLLAGSQDRICSVKMNARGSPIFKGSLEGPRAGRWGFIKCKPTTDTPGSGFMNRNGLPRQGCLRAPRLFEGRVGGEARACPRAPCLWTAYPSPPNPVRTSSLRKPASAAGSAVRHRARKADLRPARAAGPRTAPVCLRTGSLCSPRLTGSRSSVNVTPGAAGGGGAVTCL